MIKKADILIIILLVFAVLLLFLMRIPFEYSSYSKVLNVYVDGKLTHSYSLPVENKETLELKNEYGYNKIIVFKSHAYIEEADCKGHDCIKTGTIDDFGELIICAPNRLVVKIEGKGGFDAVSY